MPEPVRSPAPEAAAPADDADETADTATSSSGAAELEGFAPLVDEDIVISAPAVYEEAPADPGLDDVISESELPDGAETWRRAVGPEPAGETADVAPESAAPESPAQTPRRINRRNPDPSWRQSRDRRSRRHGRTPRQCKSRRRGVAGHAGVLRAACRVTPT